MKYDSPFLNQYLMIPISVSNLVDGLYPTENQGVKYCIGLIATNLSSFGIISYSESGQFFAKHKAAYYTKTYFSPALKLLLRDGYASPVSAGYKRAQYRKGISARIRPTGKFWLTFSQVQPQLNLKLVPLLKVDGKSFCNSNELKKALKVFSSKSTLNQSNSSYTSQTSSFSLPLLQNLRVSMKINRSYFNNIQLDFSNVKKLKNKYMQDVSLTRIFKDGGCGRWYQVGGFSYQQLSEKERQKILINGSAVQELDYSSMHPNILFTWVNQQAPKDIYDGVVNNLKNNGYPNVDKFIVKKVILMSINAKSYKSLSSAINLDKLDETKANAQRKKDGRVQK